MFCHTVQVEKNVVCLITPQIKRQQLSLTLVYAKHGKKSMLHNTIKETFKF